MSANAAPTQTPYPFTVAIYGPVNAGKSSLVNLLTRQQIGIVSELPGTTTDPVRRRIELRGIGPSVIIDTAGLDDDSSLGHLRERATISTLAQADVAILLEFDYPLSQKARDTLSEHARRLDLPLIHVRNVRSEPSTTPIAEGAIVLNALTGAGLDCLERVLADYASRRGELPSLFNGLLAPGDKLLLVVPLDAGAPAGRLILPQVQAIRSALDHHAVPVVVRPEELPDTLSMLQGRIRLVVTDSQIFSTVADLVPPNLPLTSFSMLLARQRGPFDLFLQGTPTLRDLHPGDRVLIVEGCTHRSSCDDIARVKLPALLARAAGGKITTDHLSGREPLPDPIDNYRIALLCGGCMITPLESRRRARMISSAGIPVTNFGMALAHLQGVYPRAIQAFTKR